MVYQKRKVILLSSFAWGIFCPIVFGQRWVEALRWGWGGMLCNWCWSCGEQEGERPLNLFLPWSLEEGATFFKVTWKRERTQHRVEPVPAGTWLRMRTWTRLRVQMAGTEWDCDTKSKMTSRQDHDGARRMGTAVWQEDRGALKRRMGVRVHLEKWLRKEERLEPVKRGWA